MPHLSVFPCEQVGKIRTLSSLPPLCFMSVQSSAISKDRGAHSYVDLLPLPARLLSILSLKFLLLYMFCLRLYRFSFLLLFSGFYIRSNLNFICLPRYYSFSNRKVDITLYLKGKKISRLCFRSVEFKTFCIIIIIIISCSSSIPAQQLK